MNNVILIGMPGCGKTTVAEVFSQKYGEQTWDTDEIITREHGEISKIFEDCGEAYFRNIETEVLKRVCADSHCFISVGGGCVLKEENVRIMKSDGNKVVYLNAGLPTLEKRLENDESRPLLKGDLCGRLKKLYAERSSIYEGVADFIVNTDGLSPEKIFESIIVALRGNK